MKTRPEAALDPAASGDLAKGIAEFNAWRFYDCHETLEEVWLESGSKGDEGGYTNFYQGLIKAAAGFHHLLRGNHKGTLLVLGDSLRLLAPFQPAALGIDVERLAAEVRSCLERVEELGEGRMWEFERERIPRIEAVSDPRG